MLARVQAAELFQVKLLLLKPHDAYGYRPRHKPIHHLLPPKSLGGGRVAYIPEGGQPNSELG